MENKTLLSSKTIRGNLLALLGVVGTFLATQGVIPPGATEAATELVGLVVSAAGSLLSIWGRLNPKIKPIVK